MRTRPKTAALAAIALLLATTMACSGPESHSTHGVVRSIQAKGRVLVIQHEKFPGFMEAMTMPFEVADPALARGLKPGDQVYFTLEKRGDGWQITSLQLTSGAKAPPEER